MSGSIEKPFPKQARSIVLLYDQSAKSVNYFSLDTQNEPKFGLIAGYAHYGANNQLD